MRPPRRRTRPPSQRAFDRSLEALAPVGDELRGNIVLTAIGRCATNGSWSGSFTSTVR